MKLKFTKFIVSLKHLDFIEDKLQSSFKILHCSKFINYNKIYYYKIIQHIV